MPLYVLGRELIDLFPLAPLAQRQALCIAVMSYNGKMNFGLLGDFDAMPDLEVVARRDRGVARRASHRRRHPQAPPARPAHGSAPARRTAVERSRGRLERLERRRRRELALPGRCPTGRRRSGRPTSRLWRSGGRVFFRRAGEPDRSSTGATVVCGRMVEGEHDVYTAPSLSEQLDSLLEERSPVRDRPDARDVRGLLGAARAARGEAAGRGATASGSPSRSARTIPGPVRRVLDITGLVPVLPVHAGREEAIEAAAQGCAAEA